MLTKQQRVINALSAEFHLWEDEQLDDFAREILEVKPRPKGAPPFGWLLPDEPRVQQQVISQTGIDLIKKWEGFRSRSYLCPANKWTIGYGHTHTAKPNQEITLSGAEKLLGQDLIVYEEAVRNLVKVPLNQNQYDALVSFCFNVGRGAFSQSTLLRVLNESNYREAAVQFSRWVHGG